MENINKTKENEVLKHLSISDLNILQEYGIYIDNQIIQVL